MPGPPEKTINPENGPEQAYDKLVLATGSRPGIPPIKGLSEIDNIFKVRTADDAIAIQKALEDCEHNRVLILGGGYIGLETAASLKKMGAEVSILERENRVLSRVTDPAISGFFEDLHTREGVRIQTGKEAVSLSQAGLTIDLQCSYGSRFSTDVLIIGTGIIPNTDLADSSGLQS